MRTVLLKVALLIPITWLTSCMTPQNYLVNNRLAEENRLNQQRQEERTEELRKEYFRIEVQKAFSKGVQILSSDIYKQLSGTNVPQSNLNPANILYSYSQGTADCSITITMERKKNMVEIQGTLSYLKDGDLRFICTGAKNTRYSDNSYIKKLSQGVYLN